MISIHTEGRRTYITGDTYSVRDRIRAIGCKWDPARKAWWTGKRAAAEALVAELSAAPPPAAEERNAPRDGLDSIVAGRAEYKGRTYYVAGRIDRTHWDDEVVPVTTRDEAKVLLYFRDGSRQFWAPLEAVRFTKGYITPQTIRDLREYADRAKQGGGGKLEDGYYYGPGGEILASGCSECRRLGHMCRTCEHDFE